MTHRASRAYRTALALIALLGVAVPSPSAAAPQPDPASPIAPLAPAGAPASAFPKPARDVAPIVADEWSTEEARDRDGEAEQVMRSLGVGPGMAVADIGAGAGYYTVRLARLVGPSGRVIAEDVVPRYLDALRRRVEAEGLGNVVLGLGEPHDPRLPARSADLVLMVHMYHEIEQPYGFLYNLLPALREKARVAVIDLDRPTGQHGTPRAQLLCEFRALGFRQMQWEWLREKSVYLGVFEPPTHAPAIDRIKACAR